MSAVFEPLSQDPEDFCFFDFETIALPGVGEKGDLKAVGGDVYTRNSYANIFTWSLGNAPVEILALDDFNKRLQWSDLPERLHDFYGRALAGKAWFVAWNCAFDRQVWNGPESTFPKLRIDMTLDAMVQGASSGLPTKLEHAGRACGFGGKDSGGNLMALFIDHEGETPQSRPDLWAEYCQYGVRDTELLRDVFQATRSLPRQEWEDYWTSERINDQGIGVDVWFAQRAAVVASENIARINADLTRLTTVVTPRNRDGELTYVETSAVTKVTQAARLCQWVYDRLPSDEARDIMVKEWDLENEDDIKPAKMSLEKSRIEALLAYFEGLDDLRTIDETTVEALEHRLYGGGSAPAKFTKLAKMQHGGVMRGQFVFNGAGQTGRYSSRGVQLHNLPRKSLGDNEGKYMHEISELDLLPDAIA